MSEREARENLRNDNATRNLLDLLDLYVPAFGFAIESKKKSAGKSHST